jgi:hypothetical protein
MAPQLEKNTPLFFASYTDLTKTDMGSTLNLNTDESGSSLITTMAFAAFIVAVIASVVGAVEAKQLARLRAKIADSRGLVMASALRNTRVASYYYATITRPAAALPAEFVDCMVGDGTTPRCTTGGPRPLLLLDETPSGTRVMSGDPTDPVYYDIYGRVCTTPSQGMCTFELWATYNAVCPRSGSPCLQAATIDITISLQPIAAVYPSLLPSLRTTTATQTFSISNFIDFYDPAFPPVVSVAGTPGDWAQGAPLSGGTGPTGLWRKYVLPHSATGLCIDSYSCSGACTCTFSGVLPGGGGGGGGGGSGTASACPPGSQTVGGVCSPFSF